MNCKRIVSFFLALVLSTSILLFPIFAEFEGTFESESEKSTTPSYSYKNDDGNTVFDINAYGLSFDIRYDNASVQKGANAIRFVFENNTSSSNATITYITRNGQGVETIERTNFDILPMSKKISYEVPVINPSEITSLSIVFNGTNKGSVILYSAYAISIYDDSSYFYGEISNCKYNDDLQIIGISGTLNHDFMILHKNSVLEVYSVDINEKVDDVFFETHKPVDTSAISIKFDFKIEAKTLSDRLSRYMVVVSEPDGSKIQIAPITYVSCSSATSYDKVSDSMFKGVDTEFASSAVDSYVSVAVVNVFLNEFISSYHSGKLISVEDINAYVSLEYLDYLDSQINVYSAFGCKIYLRFLMSSNSSVSDIKNLNIDIESKRDAAMLYTYVYFLCSRYAPGTFEGIILGSKIDRSDVHNFAGSVISMSEYVAEYCNSFIAISAAAQAVDNNVKMIVPISDNADSSVEYDDIYEGVYPSELLLKSIAAFLSEHTIKNTYGFSVMLESTHNPYALSNENVLNVDFNNQKPAHIGSDYISTENIELLHTLIDNVKIKYPFVDENYIYFWQPDDNTTGNALSASYAYNYYKLLFDGRAKTFIVSFSEKERAGDTSEFGKIKHLMTYIDTENSVDVSEFALKFFNNAVTWRTLISDFMRNRLILRKMYETKLLLEKPSDITGEFALWDFSVLTTIPGWSAGNNCKSVSIDSSKTFGRTLVASIDASDLNIGEYSDLFYIYENYENINLFSHLAFDISIDDGTEDSIYEVKVVLKGENSSIEAKQVIKSGELSTVVMDLSAGYSVPKVSYIRISVKAVTGESKDFDIHLSSISALSDVYDDTDLKELIEIERDRVNFGKADKKTPDNLINGKWIVVIAIVAVISVGVVFLLGRRNYDE